MEYRIRSGDTLSALARRHDTTVDAIVRANRDQITDPDLIITGNTITIPQPAKDARAGAATARSRTGEATSTPMPARPAAQPTIDATLAVQQVAAAPTTTPAPTYVAPAPVAIDPPATTWAAPVTAPTTSVASARASWEDHPFEQRVVDLVNEVRRSYGLRPLAWNAALDRGAEAHLAHMARVDRMAHDGIGDGTPGQRMQVHGWQRAWGENVAVGQTSPEQVVREWMASPGHRANILNPSFAFLSVAFGTNAHGRPYWGQAFGA